MISECTTVRRLLANKLLLFPTRSFSSVIVGSKYSPDFKQYLKLPNDEIGSYFHDVPIDLNTQEKTVNMITEVSRWSNGKFEISKELKYNPIIQDTKKGKVRFVNNLFPYHGYIHNYGAIPQTWEDSTQYSSIKGTEHLKGDKDPLDCCEIGSKILKCGEISKVKILGSLALIDDGELDWKLIVINVDDPIAAKVNDLKDVENEFPGLLNATRTWFKNYKIPAGKPANKFAFDGTYIQSAETLKVVQECHESWKLLSSGSLHTKHDDLPAIERAGKGVTMESDIKSDTKIPSEVDKWFYINE